MEMSHGCSHSHTLGSFPHWTQGCFAVSWPGLMHGQFSPHILSSCSIPGTAASGKRLQRLEPGELTSGREARTLINCFFPREAEPQGGFPWAHHPLSLPMSHHFFTGACEGETEAMKGLQSLRNQKLPKEPRSLVCASCTAWPCAKPDHAPTRLEMWIPTAAQPLQ